ncbi:hypothetical protein GUJ93_ZPchr0002g24560 [Zizania palustris]|uniref:Uncharacterized protein n=1 Tax=Zizania palustris TaxID=103762 RepID=A0A8J5S773_ZIZPA|nr:hypothetical protein GUJ93_ZPchr0002g24560 [Zizania palustris]
MTSPPSPPRGESAQGGVTGATGEGAMTGAGATTSCATDGASGDAAASGSAARATAGCATVGAVTSGGAREATIARRDVDSTSRILKASKRLRCCLSWAWLIWDMMAKVG